MYNILPIISQWELSAAMETRVHYLCIQLIWLKSHRKQPRKKWRHCFPIISLWGYFLHLRAGNSEGGSRIWPKFKLVQDIMHVLLTYKFQMDLTNSD